MLAQAIERALILWATRAGANDPEAVAHDVIVRALEGRVVIHERAKGYLYRAVNNQAGMYRRHTRRTLHSDSGVPGVLRGLGKAEPFSDGRMESYLDVRTLIREEPVGLAFMLDYVEADSPRPAKDRIRAMRLRRQMRRLLV